MQLKTVFEDDHIIVINKPAGLISAPTDTQKVTTLADILNSEYGIRLDRGGLVHRLDKDTSGLIIAAKDQASFDNLQSQFKDHRIKKEYLALVHGLIAEAGSVAGAVGRNPKIHNKFGVFEDGEGRESETEYQPIEQFKVQSEKLKVIFSDLNNNQIQKIEKSGYGIFTLLVCKPLTGRTHQIRVHLKYINHPIVADESYVGRKTYRFDQVWCPRQFLHAKKVGFYHPISGTWMELESELAEDLKQALNKLELKTRF